MPIQKFIEVNFRIFGIHKFPAAGTKEEYSDVSFLQYPHGHYFYFYVEIEVWDNDREIEFLQFNRYCESLYNKEVLNLDNKSCEMMAEDLIDHLKEKFPRRDITVRVYEDNINGCRLIYKV